jgi:hypothetical protein
MEKNDGTSGEDIGRPGPWGEDRYQQPGKSVDQSVRSPPGSVPNADKRSSTPVTRLDYESPETSESGQESESPGGDAG